MSHPRKRWIMFALACLAALLARPLIGRIAAMDGGAGLSILLSPHLASALAAALAVLLIAAAVGVIAARICGPRVGLFAAGLPLVWTALGMGSVHEILQGASALERSGSTVLWTLAVETALLGLAAGGICWLVWLASPQETRRDVSPPFDGQSGLGLIVCLVATGFFVWLIARSDLPGQTIAACWIGGILGSLAGRLAAQQASTLALATGIVAVGIVGHIAGAVTDGPQALAEANAGRLWELSRPLPLVYVAAALVAAPAGSAWGKSLMSQVQREHSPKIRAKQH